MAAKIQEAQEHCRSAEKFLKTSFLRWKPDFDSAADEYNQAAQCYRIARDLKNSKECHLKASEMYNKHKAFFHAGKSLENAILVSKETSSPEEIYNLATEAATLYQQQGSGDSAAALLDKAAKIIEQNAPELAYKLFAQAADVSSSESSQHQGAEYISKASRLLVKLQWYDQAVDSLRREIGFHQESGNTGAIGRLTVAVVLVQLARGDAVAAEKAYKEFILQRLLKSLTHPWQRQLEGWGVNSWMRVLQNTATLLLEWGNNCEVAEMQTIEQLLAAYDEEDRESAKRALMSPFIRSMDVEYARLAQVVPLPEAMEPIAVAGVRENAAPSYVSPNSSNNENATFQNTTFQNATSEDDNCQSYQESGPAKAEEEDELC